MPKAFKYYFSSVNVNPHRAHIWYYCPPLDEETALHREKAACRRSSQSRQWVRIQTQVCRSQSPSHRCSWPLCPLLRQQRQLYGVRGEVGFLLLLLFPFWLLLIELKRVFADTAIEQTMLGHHVYKTLPVQY